MREEKDDGGGAEPRGCLARSRCPMRGATYTHVHKMQRLAPAAGIDARESARSHGHRGPWAPGFGPHVSTLARPPGFVCAFLIPGSWWSGCLVVDTREIFRTTRHCQQFTTMRAGSTNPVGHDAQRQHVRLRSIVPGISRSSSKTAAKQQQQAAATATATATVAVITTRAVATTRSTRGQSRGPCRPRWEESTLEHPPRKSSRGGGRNRSSARRAVRGPARRAEHVVGTGVAAASSGVRRRLAADCGRRRSLIRNLPEPSHVAIGDLRTISVLHARQVGHV